jgi:hypothetical protein
MKGEERNPYVLPAEPLLPALVPVPEVAKVAVREFRI